MKIKIFKFIKKKYEYKPPFFIINNSQEKGELVNVWKPARFLFQIISIWVTMRKIRNCRFFILKRVKTLTTSLIVFVSSPNPEPVLFILLLSQPWTSPFSLPWTHPSILLFSYTLNPSFSFYPEPILYILLFSNNLNPSYSSYPSFSPPYPETVLSILFLSLP